MRASDGAERRAAAKPAPRNRRISFTLCTRGARLDDEDLEHATSKFPVFSIPRVASAYARGFRLGVMIGVPLLLVVVLTTTSVLHAAVARLPSPVARMIRSAQDYVTVQFSTRKDGLVWIEVADPRTRRSDKLQTAGR